MSKLKLSTKAVTRIQTTLAKYIELSDIEGKRNRNGEARCELCRQPVNWDIRWSAAPPSNDSMLEWMERCAACAIKKIIFDAANSFVSKLQ